jgi:hypothetical protein
MSFGLDASALPASIQGGSGAERGLSDHRPHPRSYSASTACAECSSFSSSPLVEPDAPAFRTDVDLDLVAHRPRLLIAPISGQSQAARAVDQPPRSA